jgi:hypothetical protein
MTFKSSAYGREIATITICGITQRGYIDVCNIVGSVDGVIRVTLQLEMIPVKKKLLKKK